MIFTDASSDEETDDAKTIKGVGRGKKKDLWTMKRDDHGKIILPSFDEPLSLQDKKGILRSFLTHTYRMCHFSSVVLVNVYPIVVGDFTKHKKASIPWGKITASPGKWIKDWDDGVILKEPTKMVSSDIDTLHCYLSDIHSKGEGLVWIQSEGNKMVASREKGGIEVRKINTSSENEDEGGMENGSKNLGSENEDNGGMDNGGEKRLDEDVDVGNGKGKGSAGSSGKRPRATSACTDAPAKKQRKKGVETRFGTLHLYNPLLC
jgi:hypothetical protein